MAKKEHPTLAAFIATAEKHALDLGITVCQVVHPDAKDGAIHEGAQSGIRLVKADAVSAVLSDGTVI